MSREQKRFRAVCIAAWVLWTVFLFSNSLRPAEQSRAQSGGVLAFLLRFLNVPPTVDLDALHRLVRKVAHLTEYAVLGLLLSGAFRYTRQKVMRKLYPLLAGALTAVADEIIQFFVPGRSCELRDMLIDTSGVLLALLVTSLFRRNRRGKNHSFSIKKV